MALPHRPVPNRSHRRSDVTPEYDLNPFLSAPAVAQRAKQSSGLIKPLRIPESVIPSPLAPNISPNQLIRLRARLVGTAPETRPPTGNGAEIWLSWKRAWDLWNNHYIPGRVNPVWIQGEYKRIEGQNRRATQPGGLFNKSPDVPTTDGLHPLAATTIEPDADGSSGGFRPVKDFPEFKAPPPANLNKPDDGLIWDDLINNTVWRPRRVGERTVKVDLDSDFEEFLRSSDLEKDRGVDCGRLPYPVLRPHLEYIECQNGAFKKKKVWDGVTGTVFNMPTQPLEPRHEPEDDRLVRVRQMFGDAYRDFKPVSANEGIFPLDIRRIVRVVPSPLTKPVPPLIRKGETLLYDRLTADEVLPVSYRDMSEDDPWWVAKGQEILLDYPPRRFPPPEQKYKSELLPVDDTIWRQEFDRDQMKETGYFVTNLRGGNGSLIVNGMEIRKGDVAGPLPKFAVIECPGGQVAFWFGKRGRTHLAGTKASPYEEWLALRQQKGWKYTGLSAGQVWHAKIKDRIERKKAGVNDLDDEEWDAWLKVEPKPQQSSPTSVTYQLPLPGPKRPGPLPLPENIAVPHVMFPSEEHELAWLTAQRERQHKPEDVKDVAILPSEEHFFPGSKSRSDFVRHTGMTQEDVNVIWPLQGNAAEKRQRVLLEDLEQEKQRETRVAEDRISRFREEQRQAPEEPFARPKVRDEANKRKQQAFTQKTEAAKKRKMQDNERANAVKKQRMQDEQKRIPIYPWFRRNCINHWKQGKNRAIHRFQHLPSQFRTPRRGPTSHGQILDATMRIRKPSYNDNGNRAFLDRAAAPERHPSSGPENGGYGAIDEDRDELPPFEPMAFSDRFSAYPTGGFTRQPTGPAPDRFPAYPTGGPTRKPTGPAPDSLEYYLQTLKEAYKNASQARARLRDMSWEAYTLDEANLLPEEYLAEKVRAAGITADQIPAALTPATSLAEADAAEEKWLRWCDIVIEANDFESQTRAASLPPRVRFTQRGKSGVII